MEIKRRGKGDRKEKRDRRGKTSIRFIKLKRKSERKKRERTIIIINLHSLMHPFQII
jgi:hypothetical protein